MSSSPKAFEPLLSPIEVSEYIGVPVTTLAVWRCTGRVRLPFVKVGRGVRYRREDIEAFLANGGTTGEPEQVRHEPAAITVKMFDLKPCRSCNFSFPSVVLAKHGGSDLLCPTCHRQAHRPNVRHLRPSTTLLLRTPKIADRPHASEEPSQRRKPRRAP